MGGYGTRTPAGILIPSGFAVSDDFSPLDIDWYRLWIPDMGQQWQDTARTTPAAADSDPVASALSLFGSAKYAEQATDTKRPLLRTGANGIGGKACWAVDATDDFLAETFGETISQPNTIYVVASFGSTATYRVAHGGISLTARHDVYATFTTGNLNMTAGTDVDSGDAASGTQIISTIFSGASSTMRRNGVEILAGNANTQSMTGVTIGALYDGTLPLGGKIGFIGIRQGADSVAQQQQIEQWANTYFWLGF